MAQVSRSTIWDSLGYVYRDIAKRHGSPLKALFAKCPEYFLGNSYVTDEAASDIRYERFLHPLALDLATSASPSRLAQIVNFIELQKHYWRYGRAERTDEIHPIFSQPLLEASLRTPCHWFCAGGIQRGLARMAFADLLPTSVLQRRHKSANTSHWISVLTRHLPAFRTILLEGELAGRGLLRRDRTEGIASPLGLLQSANFGVFLNTLSVEYWLQHAAGHR